MITCAYLTINMSSSGSNNSQSRSALPIDWTCSDLIAKYGYNSVPLEYPESLSGYSRYSIQQEFYETFPCAPEGWGYREIQPRTFPVGLQGRELEEFIRRREIPLTRPDSPLGKYDYLASGAPNGYGGDASYHSELRHPL